jgi:hypothetical protein
MYYKKFTVKLFVSNDFWFILGMIDVEELIKAFKELGVEIDRNEATNLLQR